MFSSGTQATVVMHYNYNKALLALEASTAARLICIMLTTSLLSHVLLPCRLQCATRRKLSDQTSTRCRIKL